ncbi:WD repeat-containing protein 54-like [Bacillus rossius redtenbacheri]|uniref:WD repeat-containing protein 54-like n=1 Tax=Bacillus rossius redtenbacheri TaxID=93214 RepID=UPI002FDE34CD
MDDCRIKYTKERTVRLVTTASALANNLVALDAHKYGVAASVAVVHNGYVNVIPVYNPEEKSQYLPCIVAGTTPRKVTAEVMQVLWGVLKEQKVLVVASTLGVQVYLNGDFKSCRYHYALSPANVGDAAYFVRGLAIVDCQFLCVGMSGGCLCMLQPREGGADPGLELLERKAAHGTAVTCLAGSDRGLLLGSADETGAVVLWELAGRRLHRLFDVDHSGSGFPCTGLKLWGGLVIAAYGSGHVRTFRADSGRCVSEVAAHARWVSALDVATERGYLLTVGEDSFAKVWQIAGSGSKIRHVWTTHVPDSLLVGGAFLNKCGSVFGVAGYDSADVLCYAAEELPAGQ